jgi:hypothetical protein
MALPPLDRGLTVPPDAVLAHDVCPRDRLDRRYEVRLRIVQQAPIELVLLGLNASLGHVDVEDVAGFQVAVDAPNLAGAIERAGAGLSDRWNRLHEKAGLADASE